MKHYSVLLNETIEQLNIKPDGIYVDGTLGRGGHYDLLELDFRPIRAYWEAWNKF